MQLRINIPPLTRILLAVLVVTSIIHQVSRYLVNGRPEFVALIPQYTVFYPWVYLTATFAEQNVVTLLIAGATILYGGRYLERAWGSTEFGKFVLIVTLLPNVGAAMLYIAWFAFTRDIDQAMAYIQGSVALQGAFLVAFKQLVPEHTVTFLQGILKVRVKHFPAIFLAANTLSGFILGTDTALVLAWAGFFCSWIYLRFYKTTESLSTSATGDSSVTRGDASETFAFACFWPDVVQPPIAAISDRIYNVLVAIKILRPFSAEDVENSNVQATARVDGGLPSFLSQGGRGTRTGKREEAERRRALALKALDQRLQAATGPRQQHHQPSLPQQQQQPAPSFAAAAATAPPSATADVTLDSTPENADGKPGDAHE